VPQSPGESLAESLCSRLKGQQSEVIQEASVILFATFASRPVRVRVPSASSSAASGATRTSPIRHPGVVDAGPSMVSDGWRTSDDERHNGSRLACVFSRATDGAPER
jgi:hypothetical protein